MRQVDGRDALAGVADGDPGDRRAGLGVDHDARRPRACSGRRSAAGCPAPGPRHRARRGPAAPGGASTRDRHPGALEARSGEVDGGRARPPAVQLLDRAGAAARRRSPHARPWPGVSSERERRTRRSTSSSSESKVAAVRLHDAVAQRLQVALRLVSGVRSSWAALAMKSRRICSCACSSRGHLVEGRRQAGHLARPAAGRPRRVVAVGDPRGGRG